MLTLSFVTGTEPGKWFGRFRERTRHGGLEATESDDALGVLIDGRVQLALVRLPDQRLDPEEFHVVELYREGKGVALPGDSELTLIEGALTPADLEDQIINYRPAAHGGVDPAAVREALQIVAANVGVAIAPKPLLKVLSKKLVVPRQLQADDVPDTHIALVWRRTQDNDAIQDFVGIAKGRTVNSSRQVAPKRSAREKTLAKQARRKAAAPARRATPRRRRK
ncbi:LysR substrate-binding domain-containing protein [Corynebacterium halotolerans]|uniref:LysR substrate-binding domain-containing protein n=1 Tax=Corynebacterium halotolerans TaxID=225326 RepID=UPI003CF94949